MPLMSRTSFSVGIPNNLLHAEVHVDSQGTEKLMKLALGHIAYEVQKEVNYMK